MADFANIFTPLLSVLAKRRICPATKNPPLASTPEARGRALRFCTPLRLIDWTIPPRCGHMPRAMDGAWMCLLPTGGERSPELFDLEASIPCRASAGPNPTRLQSAKAPAGVSAARDRSAAQSDRPVTRCVRRNRDGYQIASSTPSFGSSATAKRPRHHAGSVHARAGKKVGSFRGDASSYTWAVPHRG